jgi:hypothetical protein
MCFRTNTSSFFLLIMKKRINFLKKTADEAFENYYEEKARSSGKSSSELRKEFEGTYLDDGFFERMKSRVYDENITTFQINSEGNNPPFLEMSQSTSALAQMAKIEDDPIRKRKKDKKKGKFTIDRKEGLEEIVEKQRKTSINAKGLLLLINISLLFLLTLVILQTVFTKYSIKDYENSYKISFSTKKRLSELLASKEAMRTNIFLNLYEANVLMIC